MFMILDIIKALLGFSETIKGVSSDIARVRVAAREAQTEERRIEAQEELKGLEVRRDVLLAEAPGSRWNMGFRIFLSIPAAVLLWKIVVWDIVLKLGVTDQPSQMVWIYIHSVVGFYLLNRTIQIAKR